MFAKPEDLSWDLVYGAYRWNSHSPEERVKYTRQAYADDVNEFGARMAALAQTEEQKTILAKEMERFRLNYLKLYSKLLASESRTANPMITGPAKFPHARNQKRLQIVDNRRREFLAWRDQAMRAIEAEILDARPPEVIQEARWQTLREDLAQSLAVIHGIDVNKDAWNRTSFVNAIAGKVERLALGGKTDLVERAIALVREYNDAHKKPAIGPRHKFWTYSDLAKRRKEERTALKEVVTVATGNGWELIANHPTERAQICFAGKPGEAIRARLKGEGWHWAPSVGVWQRKLTPAALESARRLLGSLEKID